MSKDILTYNFFQELKSLSFIDEIWLFGSRARGDNFDRSDIDIAILCDRASDRDWIKITDIIDNADTLLKIDCIRFDKERLSPEFYDNILKDKKVIYVKDIKWKDSFNSLGNAIIKLREAVDEQELDKKNYIRDATIQRFEFTIELFWKSLKKILAHEKIESLTPRDIVSKAYQFKLIDNEEIWLRMLDDRNNTSHVYKESEADRIHKNIKEYIIIIENTYHKLKSKYNL